MYVFTEVGSLYFEIITAKSTGTDGNFLKKINWVQRFGTFAKKYRGTVIQYYIIAVLPTYMYLKAIIGPRFLTGGKFCSGGK